MANPDRIKPLPPGLRPTQRQLKSLLTTVFKHEVVIKPFDGLPEGIDLTDFEILVAPPTFDETLAPANTLRAPDKRVLWLSVFRNPDTNKMVKSHIMIIDPPINRSKRPELPREDYDISYNSLGRLVIERFDAPAMTRPEVAVLRELIDSSQPFNAFLEI